MRISTQHFVVPVMNAEPIQDDLQPGSEGIGRHRNERPQMQRNIERQARILPAQQPRRHDQVRRAADRQKFSYALDDSEDYEWHGVRMVMVTRRDVEYQDCRYSGPVERFAGRAAQMMASGVSIFRLNASYGSQPEHAARITAIGPHFFLDPPVDRRFPVTAGRHPLLLE